MLPVSLIILLLAMTAAPVSLETLLLFLAGAVLLVVGMGLFTLGADMAMMPMGEALGRKLARSKRVSLMAAVFFLVGVLVTVAEPDLQLKPEMAAPGGNISSAKPGGGFQLMSGTSMASPHMAGAAAVVRQYLQEKLGLTESGQVHDLTDALLMSTAHPALREDGSPYSPRQQGAGVLNLKDAVMAEAYLTVDGCDRPKAQLRGRQLHLSLPGS